MITKLCTKCGVEHPSTNKYFYAKKDTKDGLFSICKECDRKRSKEYREKNKEYISEKLRTYYINNKEKFFKRNKSYYINNKETILKDTKEYRKSEQGKQKIKKYLIENKEKLRKQANAYRVERKNNDPEFKTLINLRTRLRVAIKNNFKRGTTIELIGCSIQYLRKHLENQFKDGMTWDNYGEWHIDHIKPCKSFNLATKEEQEKCFNWRNLQPLWAIDNLKKGANILLGGDTN